MDIGIEALATATFLLLPGFIAASLFGVFAGRPRADGIQVTLFSLIASLFLFAISTTVLIAVGRLSVDVSTSSKGFLDSVENLPFSEVISVFAGMLVGAVLWGAITGLMSRWSIGSILYKAQLTPVGPEENVFTQAIAERFSSPENLRKRGSGKMEVPWLRVVDENGEVFGRLRQANVRIEPHEAFEVYLSPCERRISGSTEIDGYLKEVKFEGLYRHISPSDSVEIFVAPENWDPFVDASTPNSVESSR